MGGARRVFDEERLRRHRLVEAIEIVDRVVGHAGDQVPARLALEGVDLGGVAEEVRLPLVGVAADEPVEILEAHAGRPLVERPDRARREGRGVVVLAEPGGRVAVVEEDPADRRLVLGDDAVVAGEAGRLLGDHAEADRVMVPPGDQRRARRRAERRRVDVVVAQTVLGDPVHRRRRDDAAEGARHAEAGVVRDDQEHVRRFVRRHDPRRPPGRRGQRIVPDHAAEGRLRRRQLPPVDRGRGVGRAGRPGGLDLGGRERRKRGNAKDEHCRRQERLYRWAHFNPSTLTDARSANSGRPTARMITAVRGCMARFQHAGWGGTGRPLSLVAESGTGTSAWTARPIPGRPRARRGSRCRRREAHRLACRP